MAASNTIDLAELRLRAGEGRRLELPLPPDEFRYGEQLYEVDRSEMATLDISRMATGHALHLRFTGRLRGPCMRCLGDATVEVGVEAREVDRPGGGEDLDSPYVEEEEVRVRDWAHDALALALPAQLVCRPECAGLCPVCGESLNDADPGAHDHPREPDPRWEKLRELNPE
ncbi:MAG: YceD family protein [Solirubrobacterales bacterium]